MVSRGDLWLVSLDPTEGSELRKTRPCLIVSPPDFTDYDLFVVAPLTSGARPAPFRPTIRFEGKDGYVLPEQVRTVFRKRLIRKLGVADKATLLKTLSILRVMFEE